MHTYIHTYIYLTVFFEQMPDKSGASLKSPPSRSTPSSMGSPTSVIQQVCQGTSASMILSMITLELRMINTKYLKESGL